MPLVPFATFPALLVTALEELWESDRPGLVERARGRVSAQAVDATDLAARSRAEEPTPDLVRSGEGDLTERAAVGIHDPESGTPNWQTLQVTATRPVAQLRDEQV